MKTTPVPALIVIALLNLSQMTSATAYEEPVSRMSDGIKIQSPTRVVAGKYFTVKLTSRIGKPSLFCTMNWYESKGFSIPKGFIMIDGTVKIRLLPVEPGEGKMSFSCVNGQNNPVIGGSRAVYIAP